MLRVMWGLSGTGRLSVNITHVGPLPVAVPLLNKLLAHGPGKAAEDGPTVWATLATHVGNPDEAPGS